MKNESELLSGQQTQSLARIQAGTALTLLLGLCCVDFFFPTHYRLQAGIHGISAIAALVLGTYLTHQAYPLIRGGKVRVDVLRSWCAAATGLNFLGAVSGNWIYMRYRGKDGPRDWILSQVPSFHNVLMEFKEFVSLFPFPLMLATSFLLFYYGDQVQNQRQIRQFIGTTVLASWFFLMLGFVAGLVLAKLRFV